MTADWSPFTEPNPLVEAGQTCREPSLTTDLSDPSSYPMLANTDYSPTIEISIYPGGSNKAYLEDSYIMSPDSLDDWVNCNFFDRSVSSVELPAGFAPVNDAVFNATLPAAATATANANLNQSPIVNPASIGRLANYNEAFTAGLPFGAINSDSEPSCPSPRGSSSTPSLCGDRPQLIQHAPPAPPHGSLKRESPEDAAEEKPAPKRVQRKRGRPRVHQSKTDPTNYSTGNSPKSRLGRRRLHNQVERKYREGLNSELERLRRAVPTLPQRDSDNLTGHSKLRKATVLASAIDYIKKIERERDSLLEENERLRGIRPNAAKLRGDGIKRGRIPQAS